MLPTSGVPAAGSSGRPQFDGPTDPTPGIGIETFSWPFSGHGGAGGVTPGPSGVSEPARRALRACTTLASVGILIALADAPAVNASEAAIPSANAPSLALEW
jgi:hypothetical protein